MGIASRVYLRYAFLRLAYNSDPKVVHKEMDKLHEALKHLSETRGDLDSGKGKEMYGQAVSAFKDLKFYCERAGVRVQDVTPALHVLNRNPTNPADALVDNEHVFKEALSEMDDLEKSFGKAERKLSEHREQSKEKPSEEKSESGSKTNWFEQMSKPVQRAYCHEHPGSEHCK